MKKLLLLVASATAAGVCMTPVAYADPQSFLTDLANEGFTGPSNVAVEMGNAVCTDKQHGVPRATTVEAIYNNTGQSVSVKDANYIYDAAVIHLC
jgi:hypothetical protein